MFKSSYLSEDGTLLNITWNDTTSRDAKVPNTPWEWDDASWVLSACFIIFGMQTGFGMLESGIVSLKNEVNIMMKNVVDVVLGGITYWAFGYGLSYGEDGSNAIVAWGSWFVDATGDKMGPTFVTFLFQLSFASTATTIVSGAMAERYDPARSERDFRKSSDISAVLDATLTRIACSPWSILWSTASQHTGCGLQMGF
jgi:hypothetical protein